MLIALEDIVEIDAELDALDKIDDQFGIVGDAYTDLSLIHIWRCRRRG